MKSSGFWSKLLQPIAWTILAISILWAFIGFFWEAYFWGGKVWGIYPLFLFYRRSVLPLLGFIIVGLVIITCVFIASSDQTRKKLRLKQQGIVLVIAFWISAASILPLWCSLNEQRAYQKDNHVYYEASLSGAFTSDRLAIFECDSMGILCHYISQLNRSNSSPVSDKYFR